MIRTLIFIALNFSMSIAGRGQKIVLEESHLLADHPIISHKKSRLVDGVLKQNTEFPADAKAVSKEEAIPNTGLTGQYVVVDFKGEVQLSEVCVYDTYGEPYLKIWGGPSIFDLKPIADFQLTAYLDWKKAQSNQRVRYLVLNNPNGAINGIGEIEVFGKYISRDKVAEPREVERKKVKDVWGINTHDYDHIASSSDPKLANIADINPLKNERTYVEFHKNVNRGIVNFKSAGPGAATEQDVNEMRSRGGVLMFSLVGNLKEIEASYPSSFSAKGDLPWVKWDPELSNEKNREQLFKPESYQMMLDYMLVMARHFKADRDILILQWANEYDKIWKSEYHRMNPFMMAAMYSALYDGHEGQMGKGVKNVADDYRIAWMSQAYHSTDYMRLAKLWFEEFRKDGQFCADIIATNAYCNNRDGIQHTPNSHAIPPENSSWIEKVKKVSEFAHRNNMAFALTEFGADHNGVSVNSVVLNEEERKDAQRVKDIADWQGKRKVYQEEYYPKWKDQLLQRQAAWDLRYFLEATPHAEYLFKYHIRDLGQEGTNTGTYSTCGIAFDRREIERGQLELKPNGIALKNFIEQLGDYYFVKREQQGEHITMTFENDAGDTKRVKWTTAAASMPRIVD